MTELNGQPTTKGGVLLGGRQRTLTLSRDDDQRLTVLAKMNNTSPLTLLEYIVEDGLSNAWNGMMASKLFHVLSVWVTWAV